LPSITVTKGTKDVTQIPDSTIARLLKLVAKAEEEGHISKLRDFPAISSSDRGRRSSEFVQAVKKWNEKGKLDSGKKLGKKNKD